MRLLARATVPSPSMQCALIELATVSEACQIMRMCCRIRAATAQMNTGAPACTAPGRHRYPPRCLCCMVGGEDATRHGFPRLCRYGLVEEPAPMNSSLVVPLIIHQTWKTTDVPEVRPTHPPPSRGCRPPAG